MRRLIAVWEWDLLPVLALPLISASYWFGETSPFMALACLGLAAVCVSRLM